ncbi:MAG: DUF2244 domain-containing protein [Alphaproteobacteria bacterium]|nr:DUF2244 domain-containing protein [Alphaproteobacteria bacterium]
MTSLIGDAAPGADTGEGRDASPEEDVVFDALITPRRSPCPQGFALMMGTIGAVGGTIGLGFLFNGAWPVVLYFAVTIALLGWAVRASILRSRAFEHLCLTPSRFSIRRVDIRGREERIELQPYWLRVELQGDSHAEELRLRTHGVAHSVGLWLSPTERLELADALREALGTLRSPQCLMTDPQES